MRKSIFTYSVLPWVLLQLCIFVACNGGKGTEEQERTYLVTGSIEADSTMVLDSLMLFADNHSSLHVDTLRLDEDNHFTSQMRTPGFDELYLCSPSGELCRFYATEGMEVAFSVKSGDQGWESTFVQSPADTLNGWLQQMGLQLDAATAEIRRHAIMDSLIASRDTTLRVTLLLRDHLSQFVDSVYVRRLLGSMVPSAKPEWLIKSIDLLLDQKSASKYPSRRIPAALFDVCNDSVPFSLGASRTDYLLVYLWSDYSEASVDSLKVLSKLVKEKYAEKRLLMMTCCLHATDSAWWKSQIEGIEGRHTWVKGGFGDTRIHDWGIRQTPSLLLLDMYNNQQQRDVWGDKLYKALDRLPRRLNN